MFAHIKETFEAELHRKRHCSHHGQDPLTAFKHIICDDISDRFALLKAAANGDRDQVNVMLTRGVNVDARKSVTVNIIRIFEKALSYLPEIISYESTPEESCLNLTPLHLATMNGHLGVVTLLVSKGADVNACTDDGIEPIHLAAGCGNKEILDLLFQTGAGSYARSIKGVMPLHLAAAEGHLDIVKLLLVQGARQHLNWGTDFFNLREGVGAGVVRFYSVHNWTPLHFAMNGNHFDVVKKLLLAAIGLEIDYIAASELAEGDFFQKVVEFLITLDVDTEIYRLQQLFGLAIQKMCLESIKILVKRGINVNAEFDGKIPLHHVIRNYNDPTVTLDIIAVLLQYGADPNLKDSNKRTPLDYTVMYYKGLNKDGRCADSIIDLLLQRGCSEDIMRGCLNLVEDKHLFISLPDEPLKRIMQYYLADHPRKEIPQYLRNGCFSSICSHWDICFAELEKMKEKYFDNGLSLYCVFTEKDVNKTRLYAKNEEILKYCKTDDCKNTYPSYADLILKKLGQGQEREGPSDKLVKLKISSDTSGDITLSFDGQLNVCAAGPLTVQKIHPRRGNKRSKNLIKRKKIVFQLH